MIRLFKTCCLLAGLLGIFAAASASAAILTSGFDSNDEGWTVSHGTLAYVAAGGNPGGYLSATDADTGSQVAVAPWGFHGDLSAFLGGTLSFDGKNINSAAADGDEFGTVVITNGVQTVFADIAPAGQPRNDEVWHTYLAVLDVATFGPDLAAVLANITGLTVDLEFHDSSDGLFEIAGFDNFTLTSLDVTEPALFGLTTLALAGLVGRRRR